CRRLENANARHIGVRSTPSFGRLWPGMTRDIPENCSACPGFPLLEGMALELEHARRQLVILRLEQERIESATMIDRLERVGRHAQFDSATKRLRHERVLER